MQQTKTNIRHSVFLFSWFRCGSMVDCGGKSFPHTIINFSRYLITIWRWRTSPSCGENNWRTTSPKKTIQNSRKFAHSISSRGSRRRDLCVDKFTNVNNNLVQYWKLSAVKSDVWEQLHFTNKWYRCLSADLEPQAFSLMFEERSFWTFSAIAEHRWIQ